MRVSLYRHRSKGHKDLAWHTACGQSLLQQATDVTIAIADMDAVIMA